MFLLSKLEIRWFKEGLKAEIVLWLDENQTDVDLERSETNVWLQNRVSRISDRQDNLEMRQYRI